MPNADHDQAALVRIARLSHYLQTGHASNEYDEHHDAYYCAICDTWLEAICTDRKCTYCRTRPERPSDVKKSGKEE